MMPKCHSDTGCSRGRWVRRVALLRYNPTALCFSASPHCDGQRQGDLELPNPGTPTGGVRGTITDAYAPTVGGKQCDLPPIASKRPEAQTNDPTYHHQSLKTLGPPDLLCTSLCRKALALKPDEGVTSQPSWTV